jgi:threonine dehydrogenase-like Zn-dependent dehydrogenase
MRAVSWEGRGRVSVSTAPDPTILNPHDAIIRVTLTAICGSDLHLYDGCIPTMKEGDVLGHEFMGEVVEIGKGARGLNVGDRVVVPFAIACGQCYFCRRDLWSLCDNTNPNSRMTQPLYGESGAALFGYSHMFGGYPGGQAEFVRVPFADVGPLKVPEDLSDEQALFLSDILPTGYMAAENCNIRRGDTVAVWGCGPVGLFTVTSAFLLGAERVIAIDSCPERLTLASTFGAEVIDFSRTNVLETLREMTGSRGPDACVDAVGMESHGLTVGAIYDRARQALMMEPDRPNSLGEAIMACRKGGVVSIAGVYGGLVDKFPLGAVFAKGLTLRAGQTHVHRYMKPLLKRIEDGEIDPSRVITHRLDLDDASRGYQMLQKKEDQCVKVVMAP